MHKSWAYGERMTYTNHIKDIMELSGPEFEVKLTALIETARQDGVQQGLWEAALLAEEVEAKRGCRSIIAQKISKYRQTMQLVLEVGPYVREMA